MQKRPLSSRIVEGRRGSGTDTVSWAIRRTSGSEEIRGEGAGDTGAVAFWDWGISGCIVTASASLGIAYLRHVLDETHCAILESPTTSS